jgi:hypothetical protein
MNPDNITQEVVHGNLQLEMVLKQMAVNMGLPFTTGNVYFVIPTTSANYVQFHKNHQKKYSDGTEMIQTSLPLAIAACTASRGDVIFIAPGYSLAVTSSNLALSKAGVTIVGLGSGSVKPTLTFGATDSRINVTAANCVLRNLRLQAGIGDVVTAVLHATAAQNTQYIDIEFYATSTFNFINGYTLGAANISDGCKWERNYLRTADTGQLALVVTAAAQNDLKFYNNHVQHAAAAAGLLTAGSANLLGLDVRGNFVQTAQSDGSVGVLVITTSTASSGRIVDNDMKTADAAANVAIPIASKVYAARNYIAGADEVGTVIAVGTLFDNT